MISLHYTLIAVHGSESLSVVWCSLRTSMGITDRINIWLLSALLRRCQRKSPYQCSIGEYKINYLHYETYKKGSFTSYSFAPHPVRVDLMRSEQSRSHHDRIVTVLHYFFLYCFPVTLSFVSFFSVHRESVFFFPSIFRSIFILFLSRIEKIVAVITGMSRHLSDELYSINRILFIDRKKRCGKELVRNWKALFS